MTYNEFVPERFRREDDQGNLIMERLRAIRSYYGNAHRVKILRNVARTRAHCRIVLPPNWKWQ